MFGRGAERTQLELYGKLPLAKDYLRIGCGEAGGRLLREWLDTGFGTARDESEEVRLAEPMRYLTELDGELLQGVVWPSGDAGDKRKFPFTLFVVRREKSLLPDLEAGLSEAEGLWRQLAEVREECAGLSDGRELLDAMRRRKLEVREEDSVEAVGADWQSWLDALWPDEGAAGLGAVLRDVAALARANHSGPYRLPLVRELPLRDQVSGWLDALRELGAVSKDELPTLFFPQPAMLMRFDRAFLVAARRPLATTDVRWLEAAEDAKSPLGDSDFCGARGEVRGPDSPPEGSTSLRDSLRGAARSLGV